MIATLPVVLGGIATIWGSAGLASDNATTLLVQASAPGPNNFVKFSTINFAGTVTPLFPVNSPSGTSSAVGASVYVP